MEQVNQKIPGQNLENGQSYQHDADGDPVAERNGFFDPGYMSCSVVICHDGDHTVAQTEYRHEDKALKLEIDTEDSGGCGRIE